MGKSILIVDDDLEFSSMLTEILNEDGFKVYSENDGASGLVRALKDHPDMVVMDLMMPRMSGLTVLKSLREDEWGKTVPVLLLTNMSQCDTEVVSEINTKCLLKTDWTLDDLAKQIKEMIS